MPTSLLVKHVSPEPRREGLATPPRSQERNGKAPHCGVGQPGSPVYAKDFDVAGVKRALSEATKERKAEWRATAKSPGDFAKPA
jgi:hypothetical protein